MTKTMTKINIVEILQNAKPFTTLWSNVIGECNFIEVNSNKYIVVERNRSSERYGLTSYGEWCYDSGVCNIFPSKEMQDWSKFAWKKGDVLYSKIDDSIVVFDSFTNTQYTQFIAKFALFSPYTLKETWKDNRKFETANFCKVSDIEISKFIEKIKEHYKGKLNLETLEIETPKPKFKPFDKVLVRDAKDEIWHPRFFAYYVNDMAICMDESEYTYCIPYNDSTKSLLGTADEWKGGEQ